MEKPDTRDLILKTLKEKSVLKQNVFNNTILNFKILKRILKEFAHDIERELEDVDNRVSIYYREKGEYEAQLKIAGDVLVFHMHTNVFKFDNSNSLWRTSYLSEDDNRAYCGVINVYNFLADSFKYNRANDVGYMIARIFINNENHFMVQGKRQLGFLYNDFVNATIDKNKMRAVVESAVLYTLDFDLYMPPYDTVKQVSVHEIIELSNNMHITTGKRLGFQFNADNDDLPEL